LGFEVYDYEAGKADWGSAGRPLEGADPSSRRAARSLAAIRPRARPATG
jgi:hypothetical protein